MGQDIEDGRLLGGRYRLGGVLGRGGMGTVWRGHDEMLGRPVAVKELRFPSSVDEEEKQRLVTRTLREAKAIARIRSDSAITVYDVVNEDDRPWIVMELIEGFSLADQLRDRGPLEPRRVAEIGLAVLDVLRAAHQEGILHRDVKPSNVLLEEGTDRVILTDFGIAKVAGDPSITSTGMLVGAPSYISPERARGKPPGPPADLWSLGGLLYAAVEGQPPYDKGSALSTLTAVMTEPVPTPSRAGALSEVVFGLLQKDPNQRLDVAGARSLLEMAVAGTDAPGAHPPGSQDSTYTLPLGLSDPERSGTRLRDAWKSVRNAGAAGGAAGGAVAGGAAADSDSSASGDDVAASAGFSTGAGAGGDPRRSPDSGGGAAGSGMSAPPPGAAPESASPAHAAGLPPAAPPLAPPAGAPLPYATTGSPSVPPGGAPRGSSSTGALAPGDGSSSTAGTGAMRIVRDLGPRRTTAMVGALLALLVALTVAVSFAGSDDGGSDGSDGRSGADTGGQDGRADDKDGDGGNEADEDGGRKEKDRGDGDKDKDGGDKDKGDGDKDKDHAKIPNGYAMLTDKRFNFQMAMPKNYKRVGVAGKNSGGKYRRPGGGYPKIQVDYNDSPLANAVLAWKGLEPAVRKSSPGYKPLFIRNVNWKGYPSVADWSFMRDEDGQRVRVMNRGFKVDDERGYAIMITCKAGNWNGKMCRTVRKVAFDTFQPK